MQTNAGIILLVGSGQTSHRKNVLQKLNRQGIAKEHFLGESILIRKQLSII